jgi:hypothetical protein
MVGVCIALCSIDLCSETDALRNGNCRLDIVVPWKSSPAESDSSSEFSGLHVAEAFADPDLWLDVQSMPEGHQAAGEFSVDNSGVTPVPLPRRYRIMDQHDPGHRGSDLTTARQRNATIALTRPKKIGPVSVDPIRPTRSSLSAGEDHHHRGHNHRGNASSPSQTRPYLSASTAA